MLTWMTGGATKGNLRPTAQTDIDAVVLNDFPSAKAAEYRHGDRKGCLKGTRGAILNWIELWARDSDKPPIYWLNGLAGTGKSTIAQTIAERIFADGQLGASFFCSRDFQDRRDLKFIFPTVAVQLARNYPGFRSIFVPLVQSDPEIVHESLYNQMDKLIVRPLKESDIPTVIIIDALDECKDEEPASAILSVLGRFVSQIPRVKFFVTGRPESWIREGFRLPLLAEATDVFVLHNVEPSLINNDIRLFFKQSFLELARRQQELDGWPTKEQLDLLCERAAGLFVYAMATIKFVDRRGTDPKEQLDRLLRSPESSAREGKTKLKANTTLDSLYMTILQEAFGDDDLEDDHKTRSILGAVILAANPLSPSTIATLLGFGAKDVFLRLSLVHSLLILQDDISQPVRSFHKSFPDFIVDKTRCINERFHVSPPSHHPELLAGCLELMNQTLEKNMCNLPDAVINREVDDLRERTERYLDPSLQYACKSWHKHLIDGRTVRTSAIASALHRFLEKKFLFWLEVLSVLGAAREAVDALEVAAKWLEVSPTLDLVDDCFRFVMGFFEIISTSCLHIYHSALPLCPRKSIVRGLYEPHARLLARVVCGLPNSWESSIVATKFPSSIEIETAAWSPCGGFIAIPCWDSKLATIVILDGVTLEQITTLDSPLDKPPEAQQLAFSQNARLLTWCSGDPKKIISWDLQTGGLVSAISLKQSRYIIDDLSVTYSACGTMFAALFHGHPNFSISIYNVFLGAHVYSHSAKGQSLEEIWTHGQCLRFATMDSGSITTWEVGFTSPHAPTRVESLPIPGDFDPTRIFQFHPTLSRLAFVTEGSIVVWDVQDSKSLLESMDVNWDEIASMSFSSDGRFFAYGMEGLGIHLWKDSPTGYTLYRKLVSSTDIFDKILFSPNAESIVAMDGSSIRLWRTADSITSLSDVSTLAPRSNENGFILGFSPVEALAAIAQMEDETVTVLDLNSGIPRLTINTGIGVYGVGMAGSVIVVVGEGKIVTWNLPAGNRVLNSRANVNDSVLTTTFNCPPIPTDELMVISVSPDLRRIAVIEQCEDDDDDGSDDEDDGIDDDEGDGSDDDDDGGDGDEDGGDDDEDDYHDSIHLYDVPTGQHLASDRRGAMEMVFFSPDGREVWSDSDEGDLSGWKIIEDSESNITRLDYLESSIHPPGRSPWQSSRDYEVTDGGWVLSPSGKRLLLLPPRWRSHKWERMWSGRFLALLEGDLPEPVILELEG
ncbi:YVTN repeat-like/Quino protein amine dehydrogenase [Thelephora ganbajun]|uniref:YVTN repeat-like/Quino protein amine dehydrogenase n=1 Tax=Thelephora ganbajun TaxID=370292 RepID=A0ACB6Z3Z5_THEGA|nr:YVTN repeat-like/Quino protein amine dehydrogenase [Thelephora ganbajun]